MPKATKFVILRGPSGSGKSTVAKKLFEQTKEPAVLVGQDYYRFIFKPAGGAINSKTIHKMIKSNVLLALEDGYDVIVEGIFNVHAYKDTFKEIFAVHKMENYIFTFDISFEETLKRHVTKPNASEWSVRDMREWYKPKDFLGYDFETIIPESNTQEQTTATIKKISGL